MARSQYDWEFIRPLDQAANIASLTQGNQQVNAGIAAMGQAVSGYADALKQRNTDEILNTLMRAQTSADLPNAMNAVQALQQQYGRGYDQSAVRNAIDTRGSTLAARDLQGINLQNAQAAQAAIPQLNALYASRLQQANATPEQLAAFNAIQGVDLSQQAQNIVGDLRDNRDFNYRKGVNDRDFNYKVQQDLIQQDQWNKSFGLQQQSAAIQAAQYLAPDAGTTSQMIDAEGNVVTVTNPSRVDALGVGFGLQGGYVDKVTATESGNNPTAKNPNSTATGAGQFIESTWLAMVKKYKPSLAKGKSDSQILALRNNPSLSREMTGKYAEENGSYLRKNNLPVNDGTLYLAHFAGAGGAVKLLKSNPNASAAAILGPEATKANGNLIKGKTAAQVINWAAKQVGGSSGGTASQASAAVSGITPQALTEVRSVYNTAIDKATAAYNASKATSQQKGGAAAGGNSPSKWLASQKETSLLGGSSNPIFTDAADVVKMAKSSKAYNDLPPAIQYNVLDAAYARVKNAGALRYETNKSVKTIIDNLSKDYIKNQTATFKADQDAALNSAITVLQRKYQESGATPPDREQALKLINPTLYDQMYGKKKK